MFLVEYRHHGYVKLWGYSFVINYVKFNFSINILMLTVLFYCCCGKEYIQVTNYPYQDMP
jgi:hypothetical protein